MSSNLGTEINYPVIFSWLSSVPMHKWCNSTLKQATTV